MFGITAVHVNAYGILYLKGIINWKKYECEKYTLLFQEYGTQHGVPLTTICFLGDHDGNKDLSHNDLLQMVIICIFGINLMYRRMIFM